MSKIKLLLRRSATAGVVLLVFALGLWTGWHKDMVFAQLWRGQSKLTGALPSPSPPPMAEAYELADQRLKLGVPTPATTDKLQAADFAKYAMKLREQELLTMEPPYADYNDLLETLPETTEEEKAEAINAIKKRSTPATTENGVRDPRGKLIVPESIEGLRMTFRDYICYESVFLFWPDGRYTSVGMPLPTCHSYVEMQTEAGTYEWHVTDSRHAYLVFGPSNGKKQAYKFTFDTPTLATGYLSKDVRPYTFKFDKP